MQIPKKVITFLKSMSAWDFLMLIGSICSVLFILWQFGGPIIEPVAAQAVQKSIKKYGVTKEQFRALDGRVKLLDRDIKATRENQKVLRDWLKSIGTSVGAKPVRRHLQ